MKIMGKKRQSIASKTALPFSLSPIGSNKKHRYKGNEEDDEGRFGCGRKKKAEGQQA